jgi:hypothetical protein
MLCYRVQIKEENKAQDKKKDAGFETMAHSG